MRQRQNRRPRNDHSRRYGARGLSLCVSVAVLVAAAWWFFGPEPPDARTGTEAALFPATVSTVSTPELTDSELQAAADALLLAIDPESHANDYFPEFAKERLRWMVREHSAGRFEVGFFVDTETTRLPPEVLMAAWPADGKATIFIAKPRFAKFLREGGATAPPFAQQQKNDFALAVVHEIVHLQNTNTNPRDPKVRILEESRAWREVTLGFVRPLRAMNQPLHQRFLQVDDAFRSCADQLPCAAIAGLVRLAL